MKGRRTRADAQPEIPPYPSAPEPTSSDDTFATTLAGIEELRANFRHDDDWLEWRRSVVASVQAGAALEKKINWIIPELKGCARQAALVELRYRVEALEAAKKNSSALTGKLLNLGGKMLLVILGALAARLFK